MNRIRIAIIGGGISGLYAAYLLESQGIYDYVLFEARQRLGGRALSVALEGTVAGLSDPSDRFDLGPSWFWPDFQPQLDSLVADLGLERFVQNVQGDSVIERIAGARPISISVSIVSTCTAKTSQAERCFARSSHGSR
ncbi:NAD(P)-binding protein [Pseudomonas sp. CCC2.2]|uniref:NAD(P)-binding protein n=1 Tax=Pseudomonas sp. CCC2.2 TaxID=3048605 RepID=UPI002B22E963|nr:NAD(P)-binding protein [Pseudomonas sp. CCC2.2]MEB0148614.1 NAD(P)-binding protein [Pseudomonas sp. CCC2.2]